jgi:ABC-2 type transport system ATP-binding protein
MDHDAAGQIAGPVEITPVVEFRGVSKWYGNVIGVNKLTLRIPEGVTGLLGPNGAGKSTLLQLATGQLQPSQGSVKVLGYPAWNNPALMRFVGLCPEQDAFYEWMTGWDFVFTCARLTGFARPEAEAAAQRALELVGMTEHMDRAIGGYSKGMRQRTKFAQALVHDPQVLFLDEPFSGTDPVARRDLMDTILRLAEFGKSVIVSSHVLHEVQSLTPNIVLLNHGRLVATGNIRQIRDLIDKYPHRIVLVCPDARKLAARVVQWEDVEGIKILGPVGGVGRPAPSAEGKGELNTTFAVSPLAGGVGRPAPSAGAAPSAEGGPAPSAVLVETRSPDAFYGRLPALALEDGLALREVYSDDDNLEAVFKYLVNK